MIKFGMIKYVDFDNKTERYNDRHHQDLEYLFAKYFKETNLYIF